MSFRRKLRRTINGDKKHVLRQLIFFEPAQSSKNLWRGVAVFVSMNIIFPKENHLL